MKKVAAIGCLLLAGCQASGRTTVPAYVPPAPAWESSAKTDEASGTATCSVVRRHDQDGRIIVTFVRLLNGIHGFKISPLDRTSPGTTVHMKIDDVRYSAPENDRVYWGQRQILDALKSGHEIWMSWNKWPAGGGKAYASLDGIAGPIAECEAATQQ